MVQACEFHCLNFCRYDIEAGSLCLCSRQNSISLYMLSFLIEILMFAFLAKKKTPVIVVIGISLVFLVILIVTVVQKAEYVS
jgi:hypothetical protein